jgi:hypothetical protein
LLQIGSAHAQTLIEDGQRREDVAGLFKVSPSTMYRALLMNAADEKLYSKLYVSSSDIAFARYCVRVILKKGWHTQPWERRGTIYQQQAAFTTAFITAYARPFTKSHGWPSLPKELTAVYSDQEAALHKQLIKLRHTVYAHSDSAGYSIRPLLIGDFPTDIVGAPVLRITLEEATVFQAMSSKLLASIDIRMKKLRGPE